MAGALSMAAGEYVSVSSQRDAEQADLRLEERELRRDPGGELRELAGIYERRGLPPALADEVAAGAVARAARWRRTCATSSGSTSSGWRGRCRPPGRRRCRSRPGAALPLLAAALAPASARVAAIVAVTLVALALLGDLGARLGGAPRRRATVRVVVWGAVAMAITAGDRRARRHRHLRPPAGLRLVRARCIVVRYNQRP